MWEDFRSLDFIGIFLFVAGLVVFLYGLNTSGNTQPWTSAAALVSVQEIFEISPSRPYLSSLFGAFVGAVVIGALIGWIKHIHYQLIFACFIQLLFSGLSVLNTPTNVGWLMITLTCLTAVSVNVPQKDLGIAIGLISTSRSVGGSIRSVISTSIFTQLAKKDVVARVAETAIKNGVSVEKIPEVLEAVQLTLVGVPLTAAGLENLSSSIIDPCVTAARYSYAYSLRITWLASILRTRLDLRSRCPGPFEVFHQSR
ncbi:hypothetical protein GQ44DRAFT_734470 [Phaeosphaeriaceae sp. PMI808]|nr:hypothetical protein GQ44DRAFT_734470 [Phaeosphaeriaceae sp. PMI808]